MMITKLNRSFRLLSAGAAFSLLTVAAPAAFAETPKDTLVEGFARLTREEYYQLYFHIPD